MPLENEIFQKACMSCHHSWCKGLGPVIWNRKSEKSKAASERTVWKRPRSQSQLCDPTGSCDYRLSHVAQWRERRVLAWEGQFRVGPESFPHPPHTWFEAEWQVCSGGASGDPLKLLPGWVYHRGTRAKGSRPQGWGFKCQFHLLNSLGPII